MLSSSETRLGQPRQVRWLALALMPATVGLAACGGNDRGATATSGGKTGLTADPGAATEHIVIKTRAVLDIPEGGPQPGESTGRGEVLAGSSLGDSPFCPGGMFRDQHGEDPDIGLVDRTFDCPDGSLRIGFTPGSPEGRTQAGPWKVVSGTRAFEGLQGDGQMEIKYKPGTRGTEGRETFTGMVVP